MASSEVAFNSEIEALLIFGGGTSSVILPVVMLWTWQSARNFWARKSKKLGQTANPETFVDRAFEKSSSLIFRIVVCKRYRGMNSRSSCLLRQFTSASSSNTHKLHTLAVCHGSIPFKTFSDFSAARIRQYSTIQKELEEEPPAEMSAGALKSERIRQHQIAIAHRRLPPKQWNILAGVLLSRPPILVPAPHPFEEQLIAYQNMLEQHHYTPFPINFFFKKGSIGEKRWLMQHQREPKKSGSGILRPLNRNEPEWIVGGTSDHNVFRVRENVSTIRKPRKKKTNDLVANMTEDERRTLEQYAAQDERGLGNRRTEVPLYIDIEFQNLERRPRETLYCLVKNSKLYQERLGRPEERDKRKFGVLEHSVFSENPAVKLRGLDLVRSPLLRFRDLECAMDSNKVCR